MATTVDETTSVVLETPVSTNTQSLRNSVRESLRQYFIRLEGQAPSELHQLVLNEVELPLIEMVLQYTGQNQSKAAKYLGVSRGTLRKKMAEYDLFKNRITDKD